MASSTDSPRGPIKTHHVTSYRLLSPSRLPLASLSPGLGRQGAVSPPLAPALTCKLCGCPSRGEHSVAVPLKEIGHYILSTMEQIEPKIVKHEHVVGCLTARRGIVFFSSL
jgi:hypothetical protein